MKITLPVEAGGERFELILQTKDLEAHSKLQKKFDSVENILRQAQADIMWLLKTTEGSAG